MPQWKSVPEHASLDMSALVALVVEDSAVQRQHLVDLVRSLRFGTVLQACDGLDALRVLQLQRGHAVFLVITDVDMPGMDGIELIVRMAEGVQVENLIVTSARDPRLLETVETMGAADAGMQLLGTLPKPVTAAALSGMLKHAQHRQSTAQARPRYEASLEEIAHALEGAEFLPFFQPKIDVASGLVKGVEALARWQHREHGLLGPQAFIGLIERTPLMARFTLAMVEQALVWLRRWSRAMPGLSLSLNLSADDLADQRFVDRLTALVAAHDVTPGALTWEVTETMIMNNQALANLARLGLKGFGLSMDDYGIGYSSMQTLSRSPFTELKIDRIFVNGASERSNRRAILSSSLDMGRSLGISTVAEGVETVADFHLLSELRCDIAQGYLIARPMHGMDFLRWAREQRSRLRELAHGHRPKDVICG